MMLAYDDYIPELRTSIPNASEFEMELNHRFHLLYVYHQRPSYCHLVIVWRSPTGTECQMCNVSAERMVRIMIASHKNLAYYWPRWNTFVAHSALTHTALVIGYPIAKKKD